MGEDHVVRVVDNGKTTHYIVPASEYERLIAGQARPIEPSEAVIEEAERAIGNAGATWMRTGELAASMAWKRLDLARRAKDLTQRELAARAGLTQSMVSRIEREPSRASADALRRIADVLGLDVGALISAMTDDQSRAAG